MPNISIYDFSQMLRKFNREEKFDETLNYFKENKKNFTEQQLATNEFIVSDMLNALRKLNSYDNAFKFMSKYGILIKENTSERIINGYGWLLYSKYKSDTLFNEQNQVVHDTFEDEDDPEDVHASFHHDKNDTCIKIEALMPLLIKFSNQYVDSLISKLFNLVIKVEKKKPTPNWKIVNEFCDLVPPERLGTSCSTIEVERKGKKRPMELASDRENWYAYKSKALMKLGMHQECYDISVKALEAFSKFHYSNEVWFARRIALSKKNLGNIVDAIKELEAVLLKKKEWFIQKELASLYQETGNYEKAFTYAIDAINNYGDLEYKVELLFLIGELLEARKEHSLALKHYSLSYFLRSKEEWKIPQKLQSILSKNNLLAIPLEKGDELINELKKYWNTFNSNQSSSKDIQNQHYSGKIDRILHSDEKGTDGFIKYADNKNPVYFRVKPDDLITPKIAVGLSVEFIFLPAIEGKKEKAVRLRTKE